jgi:hypothetical protein
MRNIPSSGFKAACGRNLATFAVTLIVTLGILIGPQSHSLTEQNTPLDTRELRIVDASGKPRVILTAQTGQPAIRVLGEDGCAKVSIALDSGGHASLKLSNPDAKLPTASIEIDDKGAHIKFDKPGGASSYFFLSNTGESGVVLIDKLGTRRLDILLPANGDAVVQRFGSAGQAIL